MAREAAEAAATSLQRGKRVPLLQFPLPIPFSLHRRAGSPKPELRREIIFLCIYLPLNIITFPYSLIINLLQRVKNLPAEASVESNWTLQELMKIREIPKIILKNLIEKFLPTIFR